MSIDADPFLSVSTKVQSPDPIEEMLRKLVAPSLREVIARVIGERSVTFELELGADASGPATSLVVTLAPDGTRIVSGALERVVVPGRLRICAPRAVFANVIQQPEAYFSAVLSGSLTQQGNLLLAVHLERLLRELARATPPDMPTEVPVETPRDRAIPWTFERVPNTPADRKLKRNSQKSHAARGHGGSLLTRTRVRRYVRE